MKIVLDVMMEEGYSPERIQEIANGRESINLIDAFDLDIPHGDKIWLVTRFLGHRRNRLFAADCAERDIAQRPDDTRRAVTLELIERVRDYAEGRITMDELRSSRRAIHYPDAANYASAYSRSSDAAAIAAYAACLAAHAGSEYADDYPMEYEWQLDRLRFYVDEMEK